MDAALERILPLVQKPGRYIGGELNSVTKDPASVDLHFAFCFPDTYEIGMSHLGIKILYYLINQREDAFCERVFTPWVDMEEQMREHGLPLYGLESGTPLYDFDIIGFTLQYEMSFTTCLHMLELGGVPVLARERQELKNLVVGGGPCACNPEPIADFFDLFMLGDGEEVMMDLLDLYKEYKLRGAGKEEFLDAAAQVPGIYVPSRYEVTYKDDGTIDAVTPLRGAPATVVKRVVRDLNTTARWRNCTAAASAAAASARPASCTGPSGRRARKWRNSRPAASVSPPVTTRSHSSPCPPRTTPTSSRC